MNDSTTRLKELRSAIRQAETPEIAELAELAYREACFNAMPALLNYVESLQADNADLRREVRDLRRQVAHLSELLRREEARG